MIIKLRGIFMIKGIGTDIVEIARIKKALASQSFVSRVYTEKEQQYCQSRGKQQAQSYAARFSGKEAVMKAFCTGLRGGTLLDIEILPDELGCPKVKLTGYFADLAKKKAIKNIWLSLSHSHEYATAECIMEG